MEETEEVINNNTVNTLNPHLVSRIYLMAEMVEALRQAEDLIAGFAGSNHSEALEAVQAVLKKYDTHSWEAPESVRKEFFEVIRVSRTDLEVAGFEAANVDDETMRELAEKMANSYCEHGFWIDLRIIAEELDITRKG